jgi:hypothetical protein
MLTVEGCAAVSRGKVSLLLLSPSAPWSEPRRSESREARADFCFPARLDICLAADVCQAGCQADICQAGYFARGRATITACHGQNHV